MIVILLIKFYNLFIFSLSRACYYIRDSLCIKVEDCITYIHVAYMQKIIQEILSRRGARDTAYLASLVAHEAQVGDPWFG